MKTRSPRGFTLVEMLVVIFIIGILAALLLPVIVSAVRQSQRAANAMEIANIVKAIEEYYQDKGDYPPSFEEDYSTTNRENTILARHLNKCYPKMTPSSRKGLFDLLDTHKPTPDQALVAWLSMTLTDPKDPFGTGTPPGSGERKAYFEFDPKRLVAGSGSNNPFQSYKPKYAKETYYYYFDSRTYFKNDGRQGPKPYFAARADGSDPANNEGIHPTKFQIVCAGLDGEFGGESASGNARKAWPFSGSNAQPKNTYPEDNDNQTSFSEGKVLKDLLP